MKTRIVVIAGAAAALAAAGPASALIAPSLSLTTVKTPASGNGSTSGIHDTRGVQTWHCQDSQGQATGDTIAFDAPLYAWPPNHKYRNVTITATDKDHN